MPRLPSPIFPSASKFQHQTKLSELSDSNALVKEPSSFLLLGQRRWLRRPSDPNAYDEKNVGKHLVSSLQKTLLFVDPSFLDSVLLTLLSFLIAKKVLCQTMKGP